MKINKNKVFSFIYFLPILILALFVFLFPLLFGLNISFTNYGVSLYVKYVGLKNYIFIFKYGHFITILESTVVWTVGSVVTSVLLGLGLALILNQLDLKGKTIFYGILVLPWAFPSFISLLVWSGLWNYPYGVINRFVLPMLHLPSVNFLYSTTDAWIVLIVTNLWLSFPYFMTVFYSALQGIPRDLYDIAELDGAGAFSKFTRITLPSLRRIIAFIATGSFIYTWNNFYPILLLTQGLPGVTSDTLVAYAYQNAFSLTENSPAAPVISLAAAWSMISTIFIIIVSVIIIKYGRILDSFT